MEQKSKYNIGNLAYLVEYNHEAAGYLLAPVYVVAIKKRGKSYFYDVALKPNGKVLYGRVRENLLLDDIYVALDDCVEANSYERGRE